MHPPFPPGKANCITHASPFFRAPATPLWPAIGKKPFIFPQSGDEKTLLCSSATFRCSAETFLRGTETFHRDAATFLRGSETLFRNGEPFLPGEIPFCAPEKLFFPTRNSSARLRNFSPLLIFQEK